MTTTNPTASGIPVGTIVAYAAEPSYLDELANWHLCDGSTFAKADYPALFAAIGNANGGDDNSFQIPNLQGRFIRGQDPAQGNTPGKQLHWTTARPVRPISVTFNQLATDYHRTNKAGEAESRMIDWFKATAAQKVVSDAETRPINVALHWIIKISAAAASGSTAPGDDVPAGGIIPYGGDDSHSPSFPNWIRCDGKVVPVGQVPSLTSIVGNVFTISANIQTWTSPNLTGKFIRGVDPSGQFDPDFAKRHPAPNGNTIGLGTWQEYATALKNATVTVTNLSKHWHNVYQYKPAPNNTVIKDDAYVDTQTWHGGDWESRPFNAAAHYYINSVDPSAASSGGTMPVFPIGGIIAIPGSPSSALDKTTWLECDGSSVSTTTYAALYQAIQKTWGASAPTGTFYLPKLRGCFLRAADTTGRTTAGGDPSSWKGDPDWDARFSITDGSRAHGPGSYQNGATGRPASLRADFQYPSATVTTAKTTPMAGTNQSAAASGQQTFGLDATWDSESAPHSVCVTYYIRAA